MLALGFYGGLIIGLLIGGMVGYVLAGIMWLAAHRDDDDDLPPLP